MKVAVCLHGYPRFYEEGIIWLRKFLINCDVDYYIHNWCKEDINTTEFDNLSSDIKEKFNPVEFTLEKQKKFKSESDFDFPLNWNINGKLVPLQSTQSVPNIISSIYSVYEVGKMLEKHDTEYDLVIFTRNDIVCKQGLLTNEGGFDPEIIYSSCPYKFIDIETSGTITDINTINLYGTNVAAGADIWDLNSYTSISDQHLDIRWVAGTKKHMIHFSKLYEVFEDYMRNEEYAGGTGYRLSHERLWAHHMRKLNKKFQMLFPTHWYFIRKGKNLEGS